MILMMYTSTNMELVFMEGVVAAVVAAAAREGYHCAKGGVDDNMHSVCFGTVHAWDRRVRRCFMNDNQTRMISYLPSF
jgi:hypothetical protein